MTLERLQADQARKHREQRRWMDREIHALRKLLEMHTAKRLRIRYGRRWRELATEPAD